ncbi:unnamed protein product [Cyclocybe aegerita]|uniref:Uncharacterized protein n=1 Tax=Cyclocybe aegerita TaxID=1973307 RepID=A0A8S0X6I8_CYCAE|nr:unnamed protein product [Cyclocybe aegerita]
MPFVAGISLPSLSSDSLISTQLLSHDDPAYSRTFETKIGDDLQSAFAELAAALPEKPVELTLSLPSNLREDEKNWAISKAKAAGLKVSRTFDNIHTAQSGLVREAHAPRNELILELGLSFATARLVSTEVEDDVRMSDTAKEIHLQAAAEDHISQLVDPILAHLKEIPTDSGSELSRIVVIGASLPQLTSKYPSVEVIHVDTPLARSAAERSLYYYRDSIADKLIFNVAPLRVGIAKADGFVLTLIPRSNTLPQHKSVLLTTSKDDQTKVVVKVVVGISPRVADNTTIAELVLDGLVSRPKGVARVKVVIDVEQEGKTRIVAEELDGTASTTAELKDIIGNTLTWEGVESILTGLPKLGRDDEAQQAEDEWVGEEAQGALPE